MNPEQVAEVLAARTPGPWEVAGHDIWSVHEVHVVCHGHDYDEYGGTDGTDARAIVVAVNLADEWQAVVEAARALVTGRIDPDALTALRAALDAYDKKREAL